MARLMRTCSICVRSARILESRPGVRTLFVSGYPADGRWGPVCIQKPYTPGELSAKVREALESKEGRE